MAAEQTCDPILYQFTQDFVTLFAGVEPLYPPVYQEHFFSLGLYVDFCFPSGHKSLMWYTQASITLTFSDMWLVTDIL